MTGYLVKVRCGPLSLLDSSDVLEVVDGGGKNGRLLWDSVSRSSWSNARISGLPHHIQCGGGCGGETLGGGDGRGRGGSGRAWTGG